MEVKKSYIKYLIIGLFVIMGAYLIYNHKPGEIYKFENNKFSYSTNRPNPEYSMILREEIVGVLINRL